MIVSVIVLFGVALTCIVIGCQNRKGNISMLHSYHRSRVTEEDVLPFGRAVGNGMMVVGVSIAVYGGALLASELWAVPHAVTVGTVVMTVGLVVGLGLAFYAMKKYNKGIL